MNRSIYLITGPSGSGKTSLAELLNERGYTTVDADSTPGVCYYVNKNNKPVPYPPGADAAWWASHNYIWELDRLNRLLDSLDAHDKPIFLCGNAGNIKKAWPIFAGVFYLDAPIDLLLEHIADPSHDHNFGKSVAEREVLMNWVEPFKAEMLELGAVPIDATKSLTEVAETILSQATKTQTA